MKRDNMLVMAILRLLENNNQIYMTANQIRESLSEGDELKHDGITHHIFILADKGFIDISDAGRIRLTWDGHDVIERKSSIFA